MEPNNHIEVALTGFIEDENGDLVCALNDLRGNKTLVDFDVEVREFLPNGEISFIEEHTDLTEDEANLIYETLCNKYPNADHSVNY